MQNVEFAICERVELLTKHRHWYVMPRGVEQNTSVWEPRCIPDVNRVFDDELNEFITSQIEDSKIFRSSKMNTRWSSVMSVSWENVSNPLKAPQTLFALILDLPLITVSSSKRKRDYRFFQASKNTSFCMIDRFVQVRLMLQNEQIRWNKCVVTWLVHGSVRIPRTLGVDHLDAQLGHCSIGSRARTKAHPRREQHIRIMFYVLVNYVTLNVRRYFECVLFEHELAFRRVVHEHSHWPQWDFGDVRHGILWFFNIPNQF